MRKTGLIFKALMIFVFSVFLLVSCNVPHIDGPQPGWGDIENLVLSIDDYLYQGAKVPTVLAMLFVQGELDGSQHPRVHILQEMPKIIHGIDVSAAGDASYSYSTREFSFYDFYLKYDGNVYVLNGDVSEDNGGIININRELFDIIWSIDLPTTDGE